MMDHPVNFSTNPFSEDLQTILDHLGSADLAMIDEATDRLLLRDRVKTIEEIVKGINHSIPENRCQAMELLILMNDESMPEILAPIFRDPVDFVRYNLLNDLINYDRLNVGFVNPLMDLLHSDPDSDVRFLAATALGIIGDSRAIPSLIQARENDFETDYEGESVSHAAHIALKKMIRNQ